MKITVLEEAKRSKEEEAESWHSKVMERRLPTDVAELWKKSLKGSAHVEI